MSTLSTQRQIELLATLREASAARHAEERRIAGTRAKLLREADDRRTRRQRDVDEAHAAEREGIDSEVEGRRSMLEASFDADRARTQKEYKQRRVAAETYARRERNAAEQQQKEQAWEIDTLFDAAKKKPPEKLKAFRDQVATIRKDLEALGVETAELARSRGLRHADYLPAPPPQDPIEGAPDEDAGCQAAYLAAEASYGEARKASQALYDQWLPRLLGGTLQAGAFVGMASVIAPMLGMSLGWNNWLTYAISLGASTIAAMVTYFVLSPLGRKKTSAGFDTAIVAVRLAEQRLRLADAAGSARAYREMSDLSRQRDEDLKQLKQKTEKRIADAAAKSKAELEKISKEYPAKLSARRDEHAKSISDLDAENATKVAELTNRRDERRARVEADHASDLRAIEDDAQRDWDAMFQRWFVAYDEVRAELRDMRAECSRLFPDFRETDYPSDPREVTDAWRPPSEAPAAIAFGSAPIDLANIPHGLSTDKRLHPPEESLVAPTLMTLAEHPTLMLTAAGEGRRVSVELLRVMMLRFLTAMPPGKVRFTILDPVGLGDNFQAFMHLADADEQLINGRIWSEPRDIDEQLSRLTNHMETVLQKYLRSEYESIHEYNAQAGEVAEPFQVLIAAGFPTNFSEAAARRLVSLVTGGPRCGVYTMLGVDTATRLPSDFRLDELMDNAAWLDWDADSQDGPRFVWRRPELEELKVDLAEELPPARAIEIIKSAGKAAQAAVRVEVPFAVVEPTPDKLWSQTCGDELRIPVGRAGAKNIQEVRLGRGTSQHLLVAGKTGSGKSTFLHAMVTSAAMHFSPDEVEFYLVDFKKGVEFKSYATHQLPHARVIAIESEREFGLSVLERLDEELRVRGEKFRAVGVQNLADYREKCPDQRVPRVLLIVDEFQELFTEDDALAQESSLLMDRLVRQGRAFGMHVILGTQTLAGAYSIARSTLGQIAIRVALECSEADAHLILSDERNTAARFLSRPGEAIYNAQNGLLTANEPFQVVWLPDRERAGKLNDIDEYRHGLDLPRPEAIVFEGNAPADPLKNNHLNERLAGTEQVVAPGRPPAAWIGAAVAIKPPSHVEFGRHPGANLLCVGPHEPAALGMLSSAVVSLAAAQPEARLIVFDGVRPGEEADGVWSRVLDALPIESQRVDQAGVTQVMAELGEELAARESAADDPSAPQPPPIYVLLHNAGRFRELRKRDDDFSFGLSSDDGPKKPDAQLAELLRNGPSLGIHVLVWCDSYNSAQRLFDRQTMREFALRVAMQMSAADSSNLIDTPAASDLQMHRALLYNDETGQAEKFRPYGAPSEEWLERVKEAAAQRA